MWYVRALKYVLVMVVIAASMVGGGIRHAAVAGEAAPGRPVVYHLLTEAGEVASRLFHKIYDPNFQIVDFLDSEGAYVLPQLTEGPPPIVAVEEGIEIDGEVEVIVLFIITVEGRVANPVILRSPDLRLNVAVLDALARWVFEPARVNGEKVSATTGQRFVFHPGDPVTL